MSDAKAKDQGGEQQPKLEVQPMQSADVEDLLLAGRAEMDRVEQSRSNASDGSLRHYQSTTRIRQNLPADWQNQNQSIELIDGDVSVSRTNPLKEANLERGFNADGTPYKVFSTQLGQALEESGDIDKELTEGDYQSSIKLNVQVTNVPEVSAGVKLDELLGYVEQVMEAGARAVRPIEEHLSQPEAVNQDLWNLPGATGKVLEHLAQSPEQLNQDMAVVTGRILDTIDKPMTVQQRSAVAGALMPMFFFEGGGKQIDKTAASQMKLEQMTKEELTLLGIERVEMEMPAIPEDLRDLPLTKASKELLTAVEAKNRVIEIGLPDSFVLRHLDSFSAEASVFITGPLEADIILLRENPSKIAVLEEFLHGTQRKLSSLQDLDKIILELHVKDFMIRHRKLLGPSDADVQMLEALKLEELKRANMQGYR